MTDYSTEPHRELFCRFDFFTFQNGIFFYIKYDIRYCFFCFVVLLYNSVKGGALCKIEKNSLIKLYHQKIYLI